MSLLSNSVSRLSAILRMVAGVAVTYRRGTDTVKLTAIPGSTAFDIEGPNGVIETFQSRDWMIQADKLVLSGSRTTPRAGDEIDEGVGTETHTYKVLAPGGGPIYRYSDQYRTILRVHTTQVEAV